MLLLNHPWPCNTACLTTPAPPSKGGEFGGEFGSWKGLVPSFRRRGWGVVRPAAMNPLRGVEGLLILTQVVHDAVHLTGSECALAASVAQLGEFVFERLANADPVL